MRKDSSLALVLGAIVVSGCSTTAGEPTNFNPQLDDSQDAASAPQDSGQAPSATPDGGTGTPGQGPSNPDNTPDAAVDDATTSTKDASEADTSTASKASADDDAGSTGAGETGRLVGMTAAHNAVRAMVKTTPALPPFTWSPTVAAYAQQWATSLASSATTCAQPQHRTNPIYGENLAVFGSESFGGASTGDVSTAEKAVSAWASEVACWTYGTISGLGVQGTDKCDMTCSANLRSDGCGHYTQIVWRSSIQLGCGVATCTNAGATEDIWICNYAPGGNIVGEAPY